MIELIITSFCLVLSFVINDRKKRLKSIVQFVLCLFLIAISVFILPNAPLSFLIDKKFGNGSFVIIQDVISHLGSLNFSIIKLITFAIIFIVLLSILDIIEYVIEQISKIHIPEKSVESKIYTCQNNFEFTGNKIYLLFCRFLN